MESKANQPCANCQRLEAQVHTLQAEVEVLRRNLAQIQEQLAHARKDSTNSSKPPSSDLVKPPKPTLPDDAAPHRRGGQPCHPLHLRPLGPPERLSGGSHFYPLELCFDCGQTLQAAATPPRLVPQVEIEAVPLCIPEHRAAAAGLSRRARVGKRVVAGASVSGR